MQKLWVLMSSLEFLTQNKSKMSCQKIIKDIEIYKIVSIYGQF